ncbi:unnamed protein product, partial [Candidula unifasciata]
KIVNNDLNVSHLSLRSSGKSMNSGIVEVYKGDKWGYVCEDGWDLIDANVVCREIGFTRGAASSKIKNGTLLESQKPNASILLNDLHCSGTENTLHDCPYSLLNDCSHDQTASLECSEDIHILNPAANVTVGFVGGSDKSEGIVEVVINKERYRVCNDNWKDQDAAVICRMMGFR